MLLLRAEVGDEVVERDAEASGFSEEFGKVGVEEFLPAGMADTAAGIGCKEVA